MKKALIGVVAGYVNFTGKGNSKQGCKLALKPKSAVLLGVLVRDDYVVSSPFTVPEEDKAAMLAGPNYLHMGVWWMQLISLHKTIRDRTCFDINREPPQFILDCENKANERDRSKEQILFQRRLVNNCLSYSDPTTEKDEGQRISLIRRTIEENIRDYPILTVLNQFTGTWCLETGFWPTIVDWTSEGTIPEVKVESDRKDEEADYDHYSYYMDDDDEPQAPQGSNSKRSKDSEA